MFVAAFLGIYESMVPMIVIIVPLSFALGWDSLTGLGMSLLPMAFGFASSITNPFTIGVAQKIAGLSVFSRAWLRIIFFFTVYTVVLIFVLRYARKVETTPEKSLVYKEDINVRKELEVNRSEGETANSGSIPGMKPAVKWVAAWIILAVIIVVVSSQIESVSEAPPICGTFTHR